MKEGLSINTKNTLKFIVLVILCGFLFLLDIAFGSVNLSMSDIFSGDTVYREIVVNFRLPKAITALATGAALSVAGLVMQTMFKNPLADPYILGISSGASLGVAIVVLGSGLLPTAFVSSGWSIVIAAILGGSVVLMLVLGISFKVRQVVSLLIIGIMFGQIAGSMVTILQNYSNPQLSQTVYYLDIRQLAGSNLELYEGDVTYDSDRDFDSFIDTETTRRIAPWRALRKRSRNISNTHEDTDNNSSSSIGRSYNGFHRTDSIHRICYAAFGTRYFCLIVA